MAARVCRCFCRFGSIGWITTATRTFSACGVMPFLLPSRLPYRYRLLPPLAEPDRTLPSPTCDVAVQAETGSSEAATHPTRRLAPRWESCGHAEPLKASGCQSLPVRLPAVCHEFGVSHHTH